MRTVTLPPRRSVPALVAEVWDGNGSVNLVWVGRRTIGGIEPGVFLRARGRVTVGARHPDDLQPVLRDRAHRVTEEPAAALTAATPETVEALIRHRLSAALGGWRGSIETALPTVVFVVFWTWQQDVKVAAGAALAVAVVLAIVRVVQHSSLSHVAGAVFATAIAAFFAVRSGRAEAAFLPGILTNAAFLAADPAVGGDPVAGGGLHRRRRRPARPGGPVRLASRPRHGAGVHPADLGARRRSTRCAWRSWCRCTSPPTWRGSGSRRSPSGWPLWVASLAVMGWMLLSGHTPLEPGEGPGAEEESEDAEPNA